MRSSDWDRLGLLVLTGLLALGLFVPPMSTIAFVVRHQVLTAVTTCPRVPPPSWYSGRPEACR
ncbi:hypothetical protein ACWCWD_29470 [Streptomyces sp. NPDC001493]